MAPSCRVPFFGLLAAAALLAPARSCRAAASWHLRVNQSSGRLESADYGTFPVLAAAAGPLVQVEIEPAVLRGDLELRLDRGWKVISGPAEAVAQGPSSIAARKPVALQWTFGIEAAGERRAWLLARHSEVSPEGRDMAEAYQVSIDGKPLSGTWRRLAVRNFGNAWLGWLDLGTVVLAAGEHNLRITTKKDWCFLDRLLLATSGADPVRFAEQLASPEARVHQWRGGGAWIERRAGPLELAERIEPAGDVLRLTARLRWAGATAVLRGVTWKVPVRMRGDHVRVVFPGALPPREVGPPGPGQRLEPMPRSSLVILHDGAGHAISALAYSAESTAQVAVAGRGDCMVIEVRFDTHGRLRKGAVDLGQVLIAPVCGGALQAADAFRHLYFIAGLRPPPRRARWAEDLAIYSGHPGGPIERSFAVPGGFKEFTARLPALAQMGITGLWLLPIFEHGPDPYSLYAPVDQFTPARRLGTAGDLRNLVQTAHRLGIRVFFDFVPHGPPQDSALGEQFADAICLDEAGARQTRFGWAFDYANARWQKYMREAAAHSARQFGIDGTRVDVFPGAGNWDPRVPYLASFPILGGGLEMTGAIRSGICRVKGTCFVVPESYEIDPAMWGTAESAYDSGLYFLLSDLVQRDPPPDEWASTLSWWLEMQGRTLPEWGLMMRFLANHDTVLSNFLKARPAGAFGYERSHALAAVITFARGIPMIYQGEEDPALWGGAFPSSVDFYTRLFGVRHRVQALRSGTADYLAVRASPGFWTCLRRTATDWALAVVSLWPEAREVRLSLPCDLTVPLHDTFEGARIFRRGRTVRLRLPGYGIAVLVPTKDSH